ncbi:MAG: Htur_1727 family rSAM-partnered candidate RiPP [Halobacteriaceae archaeon]
MSGGDRTRTPPHRRSATEQEWEVFVRPSATDPLRHVGSVTAPTADTAHEQAGTLFEDSARDIWLCPADAVRRYSAEQLADRARER